MAVVGYQLNRFGQPRQKQDLILYGPTSTGQDFGQFVVCRENKTRRSDPTHPTHN